MRVRRASRHGERTPGHAVTARERVSCSGKADGTEGPRGPRRSGEPDRSDTMKRSFVRTGLLAALAAGAVLAFGTSTAEAARGGRGGGRGGRGGERAVHRGGRAAHGGGRAVHGG